MTNNNYRTTPIKGEMNATVKGSVGFILDGQYTKTCVYFNFTPYDLWVVERDNRRVRIKSRPCNLTPKETIHLVNGYAGTLVIREYVRHGDTSYTDSIDYARINRHSNNEVEETALYNTMTAGLIQHSEGTETYQFFIDHVVELNFKLNQPDIWLNEHDIVVTCRQDPSEVWHPHGKSTCLKNTKWAFANAEMGNNHYLIRFIDNEGKHSKRYFYIGNRLQVVEPMRSTDDVCGIHFTRFSKDPSTGLFIDETLHLTLEEAEKELGLYESVDKAKNLGDLQRLKEEELKQRIFEVEKEKQQTLVVKNQLERESNENLVRHKETLHRLEERSREQKEEFEKRLLELEEKSRKEKEESDKRYQEFKLEAEDRKNKMEEKYLYRSLDRKDTSELIKFLPALIVGAAAVFIALRK